MSRKILFVLWLITGIVTIIENFTKEEVSSLAQCIISFGLTFEILQNVRLVANQRKILSFMSKTIFVLMVVNGISIFITTFSSGSVSLLMYVLTWLTLMCVIMINIILSDINGNKNDLEIEKESVEG